MRRRFSVSLVLAVAVLFTLVAPASAGSDRETDRTSAVDAMQLPDIDARVRLGCKGPVDDTGAGSVSCHWQSAGDVQVERWQLWNLMVRPERGHRNLVAELRPEQSEYVDEEVKAPAVYLYAVIGLDARGDVVARSRPVPVVVAPGHDIDHFRLACAVRYPTVDTALSVRPDIAPPPPTVGCGWSATDARSAVGYIVYRSTDGGPREVIARTGLDQRRIVDDDVARGHRYTYAVTAVNEHGRVVGVSQVAHVRIPPRPTDEVPTDVRPTDVPPTDVRPTDVRPTDVRPTDVAPTDVAPTDVVPTDSVPVDLRPVDVTPADRPSDRPTDRPSDRPVECVNDRLADRATDLRAHCDRLTDRAAGLR